MARSPHRFFEPVPLRHLDIVRPRGDLRRDGRRARNGPNVRLWRISASLLGRQSGIKISVKAEPMEIDPDRAVPFGLLENELATNAIKHAFPDGKGHVVLSVEQIGDDIELCVSDDGIGIKDKVAEKVSEKRGSDYVAIFVRQLGGTLTIVSAEGGGTVVKVRLPHC
jgi:two-component sensor histidine kinase